MRALFPSGEKPCFPRLAAQVPLRPQASPGIPEPNHHTTETCRCKAVIRRNPVFAPSSSPLCRQKDAVFSFSRFCIPFLSPKGCCFLHFLILHPFLAAKRMLFSLFLAFASFFGLIKDAEFSKDDFCILFSLKKGCRIPHWQNLHPFCQQRGMPFSSLAISASFPSKNKDAVLQICDFCILTA